ncbi:MAG: response regulator transcription factor [Bacteroidales bacterium]|jgi:two-component system response regulator EvgA|nr:response regulator transcription factor [Bacteroidales bacterium]
MVNVFIIDDHPAVIEGVAFMLSEPEDRARLVGSSLNMAGALIKLPCLDVHVILLDLFIGIDNPASNLKLLRNNYPHIPVVIFSAEDSTWYKHNMFALGASAYLVKCTDNEDIVTTILQVSKGAILLPPDVKDMLDPNFRPGETASLSCKELEMGKDLAFGMTIKEMAEKTHKSSSSVEKTLRTIRKKIRARTNIDLIRILFQRKLIPFSKE